MRDACPLRALDTLQELDFGDWEGRRWDEIDRMESDFWAADPWTRAPPNGETEMQLWQRVERTAATLQAHADHRVGVVAHAGPLRLLRCLVQGLPLAQRWEWSVSLGGVELL